MKRFVQDVNSGTFLKTPKIALKGGENNKMNNKNMSTIIIVLIALILSVTITINFLQGDYDSFVIDCGDSALIGGNVCVDSEGSYFEGVIVEDNYELFDLILYYLVIILGAVAINMLSSMFCGMW